MQVVKHHKQSQKMLNINKNGVLGILSTWLIEKENSKQDTVARIVSKVFS